MINPETMQRDTQDFADSLNEVEKAVFGMFIDCTGDSIDAAWFTYFLFSGAEEHGYAIIKAPKLSR